MVGSWRQPPPPLSLSLRPCYHKSKIRTGESKIWKNNKNTEAQPKLSGFYEKVYLYTTLVYSLNDSSERRTIFNKEAYSEPCQTSKMELHSSNEMFQVRHLRYYHSYPVFDKYRYQLQHALSSPTFEKPCIAVHKKLAVSYKQKQSCLAKR